MPRMLVGRVARVGALRRSIGLSAMVVGAVVVAAVMDGAAGDALADGGARPSQPPVALVAPVPGPAAKVTPPPPPPGPASRWAGSAPPAPRAAEWASALAHRLGLAYEDGGAFVLLSDATCRVRIYPNTHVISLDGRDEVLRGTMRRELHGVLVPGPAAGIIESHVLATRVPRVVTPPPAAVPRPPVAPPVAPAPVVVKPKPAAPARVGTVAPDPSWVVAPTSRTWTWIVLHHSDDLSGCMSKYHQGHLDQGWEHGCGYHFVIGNGTQSGDGEVETSKRWRNQLQGAHAKTPDNQFNDHGIGICLVGDFENGTGRPTAAQLRSLQRLSQWLMDRYDIPLANLRGHCHCKPTCCPGRNFPWAEVRAGLRDPRRAQVAAAAAPRAGAPSPLAQRAAAGPAAPGLRPTAGSASTAVAATTPTTQPVRHSATSAAAPDLGAPPAGPASVVLPVLAPR
jgi:hypothetical protein